MFIRSIQPSFAGLNQLDKKRKLASSENLANTQDYSTNLNNLDKKKKENDFGLNRLEKKKK